MAFNADINAVNNEGKTPLDLVPLSPDQATASPTDSNMAAFLESCGAEHSDNLKPPRFDFSKVGSPSTGDNDYGYMLSQALDKLELKHIEKAEEVVSAEQETPGSAKELARLAVGFKKLK